MTKPITNAEPPKQDRLFVLSFKGYTITGEMVIITDTRRKALNRGRKKLKEMGLLNQNLDLEDDDLVELPIESGLVYVTSDGNY